MKSLILACLVFCCAVDVNADPAVLSRPLVIGASLADGFNLEEIFGPKSERLSFDRYLEESIVEQHAKIENRGSMMFFMGPKKFAEEQILFANEYKPSVVFAPDFLFWFLYGEFEGGEGKRLEMLELGLKDLEQINALLIVGTIPDAKDAGGGILKKRQIPSLETIQKANIRIEEWAKSRKRTGILDLFGLLEDFKAGRDIRSGDLVISAEKAKGSLQSDQLHPTERGVRLISLFSLEALRQISSFDDSLVDWKVE